MATEKLGFQELSATQANKFLTVNANSRQTEVFLTGVLDRDAGAVPGSPVNGDAYIVDVTTGAWTGFTLGDVAHYYGGTWYNYTPAEGARVWVADEDATVAWDGTAWVNEAAASIGVAGMTNNSVPYVSGGVLVEDLDFTFDSPTNTLAVPNIDVSTLMTAGTYAAFGDEDTGFLFPAVNTLAIYTGGSERARVNSGGAFLIGTTTGTDRLVVNPSGGSSAGNIAIKVGTTNADSIRLEAGGTVNTWLEYRGYLGHQWVVDSTEAMRIDSSGNLLIGTTSSSGRLCVQNANASNELVFTGTEYTNIYSETLSGFDIGTNSTGGASYLRLLTENAERVRIDSAGNVGIGTSSPGCIVTAEAVDGAAGGAFKYTATGVASAYFSASPDGAVIATDTAGITFRTGITGNDPTDTGTEKVRMDSDGIKFNGDTAAANALDDYEEGNWTPTFGGSTTDPTVVYFLQTGKYTKIGRLVVIKCTIIASGTPSGGSGNLRIEGLPFTPADTSIITHGAYVNILNNITLSSGVNYVHANITTSGVDILENTGTTSSSANLAVSAIYNSGARIDFVGAYYV